MGLHPEVLEEVLAIVRGSCPPRGRPILPGTSLLAELDLDSLQTLELVERLKDRFGVDFMLDPLSIRDLATPLSIARGIEAARSRAKAPD